MKKVLFITLILTIIIGFSVKAQSSGTAIKGISIDQQDFNELMLIVKNPDLSQDEKCCQVANYIGQRHNIQLSSIDSQVILGYITITSSKSKDQGVNWERVCFLIGPDGTWIKVPCDELMQ